MNNVELNSLWGIISISDETNSSSGSNTVRIIDVGPNTFDITVVDVLDCIDFTILCVAGCEMVISLSLPDGQLSISHSDVIVGIVFCKSCNEVPRLILSVDKSHRVSSQES